MEESSMKIPYYVLKIYIDETVNDRKLKYKKYVKDIQEKMNSYSSGDNLYMDAGFDLFNITNVTIHSNTQSNRIDHGVKCAMTFNEIPTAFYLYPRSSTGSKTPLRLSNSVGIIDSGYRGNIIALFDNISNNDYNVSANDRLVQLCGPNIMYPIYPILVNTESELGITSRGSKGFGSTGR
tara:strand:- start:3835 stop:4374 length:540 start_codon:yes stop_codon:yes gene_type:complete